MSDVATAIMDAAERRIRLGGFNGFSFREIAADVGVKSSSVHYHFPTKEKLAAAVIHRYTDEVAEAGEKTQASSAFWKTPRLRLPLLNPNRPPSLSGRRRCISTRNVALTPFAQARQA